MSTKEKNRRGLIDESNMRPAAMTQINVALLRLKKGLSTAC
jgi:hypothetical protein